MTTRVPRLGDDERDRVWRVADGYLHYAFTTEWRAYPCDPRTSPGVVSAPASGQYKSEDGSITHPAGYVEVP